MDRWRPTSERSLRSLDYYVGYSRKVTSRAARGARLGFTVAEAGTPTSEGAGEGTRGPWLRSVAAVGFLGAAIIHLAQVALHVAEGPVFAGFFAFVGALQLGAAVGLVRARRRRWYWLGIAGSGTTIGIWLVSRSIGLPFGAEPGSPEAIGTADAAASLLEGITIVALLLWLHARVPGRGRPTYAAGFAAVAAMGALWAGARASGAFDPDVRLTGFPPELADRAALVLVVASLAVLATLARPPEDGGSRTPLLRGFLVLTAVSAGALAVLTFPAKGGQNAACAYGPLAEVSGLSHTRPPKPVAINVSQTGDVPILRLAACGTEPLMVMQAEPVNSRGPSETLVGFAVRDYVERLELDPARSVQELDEWVADSDLLGEPAGALIRPGDTRELVARIRGTRGGSFELDSVRLRLRGPAGETTMTFATFLRVCLAPCPPPDQ